MKRYLTGLSMAWGNFSTLPCPIKKWDTNVQSLMLGWLPTVGLAIGLIWALLYFAMLYIGLPYLVVTFLVTFIPFFLCGYIHLDGFMDCSDAILSRRPLEDRQRILKDSHIGAFSVISLIFMLLAYYSFVSTSLAQGLDFLNLAVITLTSRTISGLEVMLSKPLKVSQYVKLHQEDCESQSNSEVPVSQEISRIEGDTQPYCQNPQTKTATKKEGVILLSLQFIIYITIIMILSVYYLGSILVLFATAIATFIFCTYGKKQLGGMNGDIAGYSIVMGELIGVFALTFC